MKTIAERLQEGLKLRGMKQVDLVEKTGIGKSSISTYLSGAYEPKQKNISKLAKALGVNEAWLMGNDVPMNRHPGSSKKGELINVYGKVAAGIPLEAIEDIIDTEEISVETASKGEYFGLQIKGDSMSPRMQEGDVVIVKKQEDAESGDIVIAMVNGNDATCKRLMKYADGIRLIATNPAYEPIYFTNEEIEKIGVKILGKVVENRQKY